MISDALESHIWTQKITFPISEAQFEFNPWQGSNPIPNPLSPPITQQAQGPNAIGILVNALRNSTDRRDSRSGPRMRYGNEAKRNNRTISEF